MTHEAIADLQQPTQTLHWRVTQADLVRYAGAARDFNPIHYDATAAEAFGFRRPVAHGMLTLGRLLAHLVDIHGADAVRSSTTRFTGPAYIDSQLTFTTMPTGSDQLTATVTDQDGLRVLSTTVELSGPATITDPPQGQLVADRWLRVEQGPATRFAETLDARNGIFLRTDAAREAGYESIPVLPTYGFVLPGWGFFPELPGNQAASTPDAVRDCQAWAGTSGPVVHAGQRFVHSRPLLVGDTVRARSYVVARATKTSRGRTLRFTDVHTTLTDPADGHVMTSEMTLVVAD